MKWTPGRSASDPSLEGGPRGEPLGLPGWDLAGVDPRMPGSVSGREMLSLKALTLGGGGALSSRSRTAMGAGAGGGGLGGAERDAEFPGETRLHEAAVGDEEEWRSRT